jgi:hypothetical protein
MVLEHIAGTMPWVCGMGLALMPPKPALSPVIISAPSLVRACCSLWRNFLGNGTPVDKWRNHLGQCA